jgi:preprotein translocase subunit YajC
MEQQGSLLGSLMPLVVLFAIFYFLIIRPQQKQQKEHNAMLEALAKGDKIITTGGLIVEIEKVEEEFYTIKQIDGSTSRLAKAYVSSKIED